MLSTFSDERDGRQDVVGADPREYVRREIKWKQCKPNKFVSSKEVHVYFFRGEGCSHCAEAEEWFESIEEEYGDLFEVVDYETWYDQDNAELMQKVAEARGETAEGVPYIIIGNKSWAGFAQDYTSEMIAQIKSEYEVNVDERYDIIKQLPDVAEKKEEQNSTGHDVFALVLILAVVGGVCFGVYKARNAVK